MKAALLKIGQIALLLAAGLGIAAGGLFLLIVQPGGSGILAWMQLPDGGEYMVTQRCNWSAEPYTVAFYMRPAGGRWGWCYIDHEASRWRSVRMKYEEAADAVVVTERGTRRAALDRKRSAFWIDNGDFSRELAAPQEVLSESFDPRAFAAR